MEKLHQIWSKESTLITWRQNLAWLKIAFNLLFEIIDWSFCRKVELYKVRRGGQVVYVIAFYSEDLSSNAAQAYILFCKICVLKEAVVGGPLKKVEMYKNNNDEKEFVEP